MSNEDILNARLANQVIANLGEMEVSKAKTEQASQLRQQLRSTQAASSERSQINQQQQQQQQQNLQNLTFKNKKLTREVEFYKSLLSKPMAEIASQNESFRATYNLQLQGLASWMVSQRAFKELAIDFGIQLGKSKEETVKEGHGNKAKVYGNTTKHGNNLDSLGDYQIFAEQIKDKDQNA